MNTGSVSAYPLAVCDRRKNSLNWAFLTDHGQVLGFVFGLPLASSGPVWNGTGNDRN
jgi:uncharacterized OB-fold protein